MRTIFLFFLVLFLTFPVFSEEALQPKPEPPPASDKEIAAPVKIDFIFAPPDGTTYRVEKIFSTQSSLNGHRSKAEKKVKTKVTIRQNKKGYGLTSEMEDMQDMLDEISATSPVLEIFRAQPLVTKLTPLGAVRNHKNYDLLFKTLQEKFDPSALKNLGLPPDAESMAKTDTDNWNAFDLKFRGRTATIGDRWIETSEITLPDGRQLSYYTLTTLTDLKECGQATCARLVSHFAMTPDDLKRFIKTEESLPPFGWVLSPAKDKIELSGDGEQWIEPETLLTHKYETKKVFRISPADQSPPWIFQEKVTYNYTYLPRDTSTRPQKSAD